MEERLQKVLASAGVASRRGAEDLISAGHVTVNGHVARLGDRVDASRALIEVRGIPISQPQSAPSYVALNKPRGYVTSLRSTHGEPVVPDLVSMSGRLFPVGRLDKDSEGLLLLTGDGAWANLITHPRYGIQKEYEVRVQGSPGRAAIRRLRSGLVLPDGAHTAPADVRLAGEAAESTMFSVTVVEGKKRQIRLMFEAVGHPVLDLQRVRIGPIHLGGLRPGEWRALRAQEVEAVRELAGRRPAPSGT